MRTTLTLDKDVAARLKRLRKDRPFKTVVNEALRAGLDRLEGNQTPAAPYSVKTAEGKPRRTDLDNVAQLIAEVEGDQFR